MKRVVACIMALCLLLPAAVAETPAVPDWVEGFVEALWSGEQDEALYALFSEAMSSQLSLEQFSSVVPQLTATGGKLVSTSEISAVDMGQGLTLFAQQIELENQVLTMQLALDGEGHIAGLVLVPVTVQATPAPLSAGEAEVSVGADKPLPGILCLPAGDSFPAVVMVHGSGPNNRDESIGSTALFRDLAEVLYDAGIASLRYDKRTYVYGSQMTAEEVSALTVEEETIQDAIAAARLLRETPGVTSVYLLGHSMGAMLGPRIAEEADGLFDGMILLSGTPNTLLDIAIDQNQAAVDGIEDGEFKTAQQEQLNMLIAQAEEVLGLSDEEIKQQTIFGTSAWYFAEMIRHDAASILRSLALPTLIINGGSDFQIVPENGYLAWKNAVGDLPFVTLSHYEGLNHVLMVYTGDPAQQGTMMEYNTPAHLDEGVASEITGWISNRQ